MTDATTQSKVCRRSRLEIVNFLEWYRYHYDPTCTSFANHALRKSAEAIAHNEWEAFDRWFAIYRRERPYVSNSNTVDVRHIFAGHNEADRPSLADALKAKRAKVTNATWYFDFVSPFAYLQFFRLAELPENIDVTLKPVVLGALLKHWDIKGAVDIPPKRQFVYRFCKWNAEQRGIPFAIPPTHPFNPLPPLRLALAAGVNQETLRTIFHFIYGGEGNEINSDKGISTLAERLGINNVETVLANQNIKDRLRANTDAAIGQGVFGVPTFVIENNIFWGDDATAMLQNHLQEHLVHRSYP